MVFFVPEKSLLGNMERLGSSPHKICNGCIYVYALLNNYFTFDGLDL